MRREDIFYGGFVLGIFGYIVFWMYIMGPWLHAEQRRIGRPRGGTVQ